MSGNLMPERGARIITILTSVVVLALSLAAVRHAGPSGDTDDYPSDEVQIMAQHIASELAASVWSVQGEKEADKSTLRRYSIGGDDDVIE